MTTWRDRGSFYQALYLIKERNTVHLTPYHHRFRLECLTKVQHALLEKKMGDSER